MRQKDFKFKMKTIGFLGAGNMAQALARGVIRTGVNRNKITAGDVSDAARKNMQRGTKIRTFSDNADVISKSAVIILAVKPGDIDAVLLDLKGNAAGKTIISIAAGISTSYIERNIGGKPKVIRVMPNLPAKVGKGMAGICKGRYAGASDLRIAREIFDSVGKTVFVKEKQMDAVTALSGSGPAYLFYLAESMAQAGRKLGLNSGLAELMARQTVIGGAGLLEKEKVSPSELRKRVTSSGGTTAAAMKIFEKKYLKDIIASAMSAADQRSRELKK